MGLFDNLFGGSEAPNKGLSKQEAFTGILVAGRSGSAFAARIGSMSVSQEVDALGVMGIDPVRYLVAPALLAMLVMLPVLTVLADAAGSLEVAIADAARAANLRASSIRQQGQMGLHHVALP